MYITVCVSVYVYYSVCVSGWQDLSLYSSTNTLNLFTNTAGEQPTFMVYYIYIIYILYYSVYITVCVSVYVYYSVCVSGWQDLSLYSSTNTLNLFTNTAGEQPTCMVYYSVYIIYIYYITVCILQCVCQCMYITVCVYQGGKTSHCIAVQTLQVNSPLSWYIIYIYIYIILQCVYYSVCVSVMYITVCVYQGGKTSHCIAVQTLWQDLSLLAVQTLQVNSPLSWYIIYILYYSVYITVCVSVYVYYSVCVSGWQDLSLYSSTNTAGEQPTFMVPFPKQ